MKNRILNTSVGSFLQIAFLDFGSFLVVIFLTRILTVQEYGIISIVNTIVFFAATAMSLGVPNSMARYLAVSDSYDYRKYLIGKGLTVLLPWYAVAILGFMVSLPFVSEVILKTPELLDYKYIILFIVLLEVVRLYIEKISHGTMNMGIAAKLSAYTALFLILITIPAVFYFDSVMSVLSSKLVALSLPLIPICFMLYTRIKASSHSIYEGLYPGSKDILNYGIPLCLISFAGFGFLQMDIILLAFFMDSAHVAYYSVCIFIFAKLTTLPRALGNGMAPVMARSENQSNNAHYYITATKLTLLYSFPIMLFAYTDGEKLLSLVFGSDYKEAYVAFSVLGLYFFIASLLSVINPIMDFSGKASARAKGLIIGAIINIVLDIILIPIYGMTGAAIATVLGYLIFFMIVSANLDKFVITQLINDKSIQRLILFVFSTAIVFTITVSRLFSEISFIINAIFYVLIYPILVHGVGAVDIRNIKQEFKNW